MTSLLELGQNIYPQSSFSVLSIAFQNSFQNYFYLTYILSSTLHLILKWNTITYSVASSFTVPIGFACNIALCETKVTNIYLLIHSGSGFLCAVLNNNSNQYLNYYSQNYATINHPQQRLADISDNYLIIASTTQLKIFSVAMSNISLVTTVLYASIMIHSIYNVTEIKIISDQVYLWAAGNNTANLIHIVCSNWSSASRVFTVTQINLSVTFINVYRMYIIQNELNLLDTDGTLFVCNDMQCSNQHYRYYVSQNQRITATRFRLIIFKQGVIKYINFSFSQNITIVNYSYSHSLVLAASENYIAISGFDIDYKIKLFRQGSPCQDNSSLIYYSTPGFCRCRNYDVSNANLSCATDSTFPFYFFILIALTLLIIIVALVCCYLRCNKDKQVAQKYNSNPELDIIRVDIT